MISLHAEFYRAKISLFSFRVGWDDVDVVIVFDRRNNVSNPDSDLVGLGRAQSFVVVRTFELLFQLRSRFLDSVSRGSG